MKRGDLVIIHGEFPNVPLYPGGDLEMRPFLAQLGDIVILLDDIYQMGGYVKVLHPVGGICGVSKRRLDPFKPVVQPAANHGITGS